MSIAMLFSLPSLMLEKPGFWACEDIGALLAGVFWGVLQHHSQSALSMHDKRVLHGAVWRSSFLLRIGSDILTGVKLQSKRLWNYAELSRWRRTLGLKQAEKILRVLVKMAVVVEPNNANGLPPPLVTCPSAPPTRSCYLTYMYGKLWCQWAPLTQFTSTKQIPYRKRGS